MAATAATASIPAESQLLKSLPPKPLKNKPNPSSQHNTLKSRKESPPVVSTAAPTINVSSNDTSQPPILQSQVKKLSRKSSKPFINWFQRKLAGTRARRVSESEGLRSQRVAGTHTPNLKEKRRSSVPVPPLPPLPVRQRSRQYGKSQQHRTSIGTSTRQNAISLDSDYDLRSVSDSNSIDFDDHRRSSSVLDSTWSPNSVYEADEDASVRPIPPSAPPSPSPSHSSSSYLSHPRTFASMAASTKPTTLLSVDLTGGMAHIAQAPPTPTIPSHRVGPHVRTHSATLSTGGSITFSMLPPASPSRPSSSNHGHIPSSSRGYNHPSLQAPQHTTHHPRNNPRPSSPPLDDASVLTLASSAFGFAGARSAGALARSGRTSVADDSISHFSHPLGDSTSQFLSGDGDGEADDERAEEERYHYGDVDASVRALRPRSSRRGSWESEASGWSARLPGGTPNGLKERERSLWTNGSHRTGARSIRTENDPEADGEEQSTDVPADNDSPSVQTNITTDQVLALPVASPVKDNVAAESVTSSEASPAPKESSVSVDKLLETPRGAPLALDDHPDPEHQHAAITVTTSSTGDSAT